VSVAIAPEGTRSLTPRLNEFKKGAFHLAMQAEVPVVPVVLRNAGEAMWRNAKTMRPATIEVYVHEPIDVRDWKRADLGHHVAEVEQLYRDTLEHWPRNGEPIARAA
jgi:putative phosphoserine phosphatase/1-acylglycerol-3-phosphate O-acyltransferase